MSDTSKRTGSCLCGGVKFEIAVPEPHCHACHCGMCRRWSGAPWMAVQCPGAPGYSAGKDLVTWFRGSKWAERGFCSRCGSNLFFRMAADPSMLTAVSVEAFDEADDISLDSHIYIDAKPGRYEFAGDAKRLTGEEFMALVSGGSD